MQIFKNTCLTWWQIGMFKWGVFGCGLLVGAYFAEWVWTLVFPIVLITVICCVYITIIWLKQQRT